MSNPKIQPLHDNVIVRRIEAATKSAGGIVLPGSSDEKSAEAIVVAVGPGRTLNNGEINELDVVPGDRILFGQKSGLDIKVEGEKLVVLTEDEIIAILR